MTMQKRIILGIFVGLLTVLCMSLYTYCNLKFNSVYYAQHIPHKEGTEPDLVMLIENMDWIYTPKIDGIRYDNDGTNAIINTKSKSFLTKSLGSFLYDKDNMTVGFDSRFRFEDVSYFSEEAKRIQVSGCLIYFIKVGLIRNANPTECFWVYWPEGQGGKSMRFNGPISLGFMTANF